MSSIPLVRIWIWISVLATAAGWILSALGQLNRIGYLVFFGVAAAVYFFGRKRFGWSAGPIHLNLKKLSRRFRRPWPLCFAVLSVLILLGAILYPPSNHTALSYRTPRVLHWLAEGQWHWIHTSLFRMNDRACGIEWLSAPLMLFTRTDRLIVLLNFIPFLLLPGLIFSVCTRLGVKSRVAWNWMWILPTGYNFLLQAGSTGNDTFPTVYALAAIDFGCRAWSSRRVGDLWMSGLAMALLVGAKASNLPLLLPWALLVLPLLPLAKKRPILTVAVVLVAALVSFLPTAILNIIYCHDWSGLNLERTGMNMKNPIVGIWGNVLLFLVGNLAPPFFPLAGWWNQNALSVLPHAIVAPMVANFEEGFHKLGELPTEDATGIGFGISVLVAVSLLGALLYHAKSRRIATVADQASTRETVKTVDLNSARSNTPLKLGVNGSGPKQPINEVWHQLLKGPCDRGIPPLILRCALIAPWIALLAYCTKSGMVSGVRLISPYYPLLLPLVLVIPGSEKVVRSVFWRALVWANLVLAGAVLVVAPGRPLWPAETILSKLHATHPANHAVERALDVYKVYGIRWDPIAKVRDFLPVTEKTIGFMASEDDIDISLWRPFGSRRVEHILLSDSVEEIRQRGIQYVVVGGFYLVQQRLTLEAWMERIRGKLIGATSATVKVSEGSQNWYVVSLAE
jgi:hypothetical protein